VDQKKHPFVMNLLEEGSTTPEVVNRQDL